jgi:tetratricopeptide (TPR) repeat protein
MRSVLAVLWLANSRACAAARTRQSAAHRFAVASMALLAAGHVLAPGTVRAAEEDLACPPLRGDRAKLNDYRVRDSDPFLKWSIADNMQNHTGPAIARMRAGEYSHTVMADLNFTLAGWPNHLTAIQALIQYNLGGGKTYEFPPIECYFLNARQFAPDDIDVIEAEAYFHWKKGDTERARAEYENALTINPNSASAHYNLGLLLAHLRQFSEARDHAQAAYAAGYPLQGLRKILEKNGQWQNPSPPGRPTDR